MADIFHINHGKVDGAYRFFPLGSPKDELLDFMKECERENREGHLATVEFAVNVKGPNNPELEKKRLDAKLKSKQQF